MQLALSVSMQFLWDLLHQLQVLNLMLLLNVDFPSVIPAFIDSFEVASANLEEITKYVPEIPNVIIDEAHFNDDFYLYNEEIHGEFPILLIEYKDAIIINVTLLLVLLPILKLITLILPK